MRKRNRKRAGLSLIELVVGVAMLIFILANGFMVLHMLSRGSNSVDMQAKARQKMRNAAEEIRKEAASFDDMDETPNLVRPKPPAADTIFPQIKTYSTTGPIDSNTRTRSVTVRAEWREGSEFESSTYTFLISHIRGKVSGASIKVKVVSKIAPNPPVAGVVVSSVKQDAATETSCTTNTNGECTVPEVLLGSNVDFYVDGAYVRYYFDTPDVPSPVTKRKYTVVTTADSTNLDYFNSPIQMNPPGYITGTVTDIMSASNDGIANAELFLYKIQGTLKIDANVSGGDYYQKTDSNGNYQYGPLYPGKYQLLMRGTVPEAPGSKGKFAALAIPDDYKNNSVTVVSQNPGNSTVVNFKTIERGTLTGRIRGVGYINGNWVEDEKPTTQVSVRVDRTSSIGYDKNTGALLDYTDTLAWQYFYGYSGSTLFDQTYQYQWSDGINPDQVVFPHFTPAIVHDYTDVNPQDGQPDHPEKDQFNYAVMRSTWTPFPFTPIIVAAPNGLPNTFGSVYFYFADDKMSPANTKIDTFRVKVFTNGTTGNSQTQNLYLMEQYALANVSGDIAFKKADGSPEKNVPNNMTSYTSVDWTNNGYVGVEVDAQKNASLNENYSRPTSIPAPDASGAYFAQFDMARTFGSNQYALPPNFPNETTIIFYKGEKKNPSGANLPFDGTIDGYEKVQSTTNPGTGSYQEITDTSKLNSVKPLTIIRHWYDGGVAQQDVPGTLSFSNGTFATAKWKVNTTIRYAGQSTPAINLQPGQPITNFEIDAYKQSDDYFKYYIEVTGDPSESWAFAQNWGDTVFTVDPTDSFYSGSGPLKLYRIGHTGEIYGKIVDKDDNIITGAKVFLYRDGYKYDQFNGNAGSVANASAVCTTCSGAVNGMQFAFKNDAFVMMNDLNLHIVVQVPSYSDGNAYHDGWNGVTYRQDFKFVPAASGGNGGSG